MKHFFDDCALLLPPLIMALLVSACGTVGVTQRPEASAAREEPGSRAATPAQPAAPAPGALYKPGEPVAGSDRSRIYKGSGNLVASPQKDLSAAPASPGPAEDVSLNFEAADIREVVKNILTDILNEGYMFDPGVNGTVTLRSTKPIPRSALLATLETVLRMNGAALVKEAGVFKIVPAANAQRGSLTPQLGGSGKPLPQGFSVRLVPLSYVGVREMARILDPFVKDAATMRVDDLRNMIILFGTEREHQHLLNTIEMFDVDWMSGMSVGLFTLQSADVKAVNGEIEKIMGDKTAGPLAGILRVMPIERLNALLVITPQPRYLEQIKLWVERLDKGGDSGGTRLFVYNVQNGRADKLAPLLTQAFTGRAPAAAATPPSLAPGQTPATIASTPQGT
ncbi:MAG: type II secretion system protein GspD, partial [Burkholderiales bacterium]